MYHVLNRANARMTIFEDDADYEAFEKVLAQAVERTQTRLVGLLPDAQPLASGRLAAKGRRIIAIRRLADADAHAALARPSPFDRLGPRLSGTLQVVSDSGRRASLLGRAVCRAKCPAGEFGAARRAMAVGKPLSLAAGGGRRQANCWRPGHCRAKRNGSTTSTLRKPRPNCRPCVAACCGAIPSATIRGASKPCVGWAWNRPFVPKADPKSTKTVPDTFSWLLQPRPRTGQVIPTCDNCKQIFGTNIGGGN